jgi:calcineurin-like phosphoesterase family protein
MNSFLAADLHFEHPGITNERQGVRLRPFLSVEEHDEAIIERWNKKVGPYDKVFVLGDLCMKVKGLKKICQLNGKKHLIKGNHDIFDIELYKDFYQISSCRVLDLPHVPTRMLLTHIPVHPMELDRFRFNVHGHLHDKAVMLHDFRRNANGDITYAESKADPRYMCVSMEHTNYEPIALDEVIAEKAKRGIDV